MQSPKWYQGTLFKIFLVLFLMSISLSFWFPFLAFKEAFIAYLMPLIIPLLSGFFVGGLIDFYVPSSYITKHFSSHHKRNLLKAVGFGFLMSACCHGILAIAIELYKKGASTSSVITFLLASPWANLPFTFLLFGFFGAKAILFIGAAIFIALVTGRVFALFERYAWVEKNPVKIDIQVYVGGFSFKKIAVALYTEKGRFQKELKAVFICMLRLTDRIIWWVLIGLVMAVWIGILVPHDWIVLYMGKSLLGSFITLFSASILEVCSEGTAPLAFELYKHSQAFGNVLIFLLAGVATDYTEIGLLWQHIGKKTAIILPLVSIPQIIALGLFLNYMM